MPPLFFKNAVISLVPYNSILSYIFPLVYTRKGQISLCAVKTTKCIIWPFRDN